MKKNVEIKPNSAPAPKASGKIPDVKAAGYVLRDARGRPLSPILDQSTERTWRNCLYPATVTFEEYYRMYARNNVAARVIETFPDYCWSSFPIVSDKRGPKGRFAKAATALLLDQYKLQDGVRQSLVTSMKQLDVLGGIGGEGLLVFGFTDSPALSAPVTKSSRNKISWIKVLHSGQFEIEKWNEDKESIDYGDVLLYKTKSFASDVDLNQNKTAQIAPGITIHATRCVRYRESAGLAHGTSRIQKCYNQLLDLTKLSGASAEIYWLGAFSGLSIETNPDSELDDDVYTRMKEEAQKYFDGLARSLILEGAQTKPLYPAIVSPKDHFDLQITMISIATGIPRRFLTGAEAAKLASQQDTLNWMERVTNRRETFVGPKVVAPVIQRCIDAGVLQEPADDTFTVMWPRVQSIALNERAIAARNMTESLISYFSSGMASIMPFRGYLIGVCGYSESEADDISSVTDSAKWKEVKQGGGATAPASPAPSENSSLEQESEES